MRNISDYRDNFLKLPFEREMENIRRTHVLKVLTEFKFKTVLEVGCGVDSIGNYLDNQAIDLTVVEPDPYFLKAGTEFIRNCTRFNGFFEEFPVGEKFDLIIVSCLLHEIKEPQIFLKHLSYFCGENTIVHINVPNSESLHRLAAVEMGMMKASNEPTTTQSLMQQSRSAYSMKDLIKEVELANFKIVSSGGYLLKANTHYQLSEMMKIGIINEEVLGAYVKLGERMPEIAAEIFINMKFSSRSHKIYT